MDKPSPLTDEQLRVLTDAEMRQAVGYYGGKLAEQRRRAEVYYLGLAKDDLSPPEVEGRSAVVSTDVRNTIEAMLPQLMIKFTGGETVVEFEPVMPDDEQKAQNATDYLNYLFFKKNNGHQLTYTWFKDALLQKRGFLKVWWDNRSEETREEYFGNTAVQLALLMDDPEIEITEQKSYPDEDDARQRQKALEQLQAQLDQALNAAQKGDQQAAQVIGVLQGQMQQIQSAPPVLLYDVVAKRTKKAGKICIENVPPEEMLISRKTKADLQQSPFVAHRVARTVSELRSMGYKNLEEIAGDDQSASLSMERVERLGWDDEQAYLNLSEVSMDDSQRIIWVTECYLRVDYDGDGIAELRKVVRAGDQILENEVVDVIPFVSICPVPLPHKFFGLSIADLGMEGQKTNTAILRSVIDNLYLEVNGRYFAVENQVNLDDLLSSRPGGVVRIKSQGAVGRLDQGKGNLAESMSMLEYMKGFVEEATGWSRLSQGNDPSALQQPETATKANIVTNKADMRLDLIARNFAEGFVDLFRMMLKLVTQYQNKTASIRLSGQWVDMDPREWRNQFDVSINVGLGVGNKDQQVAHLMTLFQAQGSAGPLGVVTPENVFNTLAELAKNMGFKTPEKFVTKPNPNQPPPNPMQGQMQIEQMKAQMQAQTAQATKQAELELERQRMQMQAQVDQHRQQVEAQQQQARMSMEMELDRAKTEMQMQMEREKAQLMAQVQLEIARINAEGKIAAAEATAKTTLTPAQEQAADAAVGDDA